MRQLCLFMLHFQFYELNLFKFVESDWNKILQLEHSLEYNFLSLAVYNPKGEPY